MDAGTRREVASGTAVLPVDEVGTGPPVVLLHAGVADRRSWRAVAQQLHDRHRLLAYDRRGFGTARWEAEEHDDVADLWRVMDACEVDRAVLVGNSQGGRVALDAAFEGPDRVRGLVLIGTAVSGWPVPDDDEVDEREEDLDDRADAAAAAGDVDEANRLEAQLWLDGPRMANRVTGPARDLFLEMNGRALAAPATGPRIDRPGAWDRLEELAVPTLVLVGDLDLVFIQRRSEVIADRIPGARHQIVAGTAHLPQLERPEEIAGTIAAWAEDLPT